MKHIIILLLLTNISVFSNAQKDSINISHKNIIKFTPLKLAGIDNPAIEMSYERVMGKKFATLIMTSYLLHRNLLDYGSEFKPNINGYRIAIEEKFYYDKNKAPTKEYFGFEINYMKSSYGDIWRFGIENIYSDTSYNNTNYLDTFKVKKETLSINLKWGYQFIIKRFSIDIYSGLGIRFRNVRHFDRFKPTDAMEMPRSPNWFYISNKEGRYCSISIPLNVRIGLTF